MRTDIYLGNCVDGLKGLDDNSVDCVVTSPPYKDVDNFSFGLILDVFTEVFRVMKPDSLLFLNFGHLAESKSRPLRVATFLEDEIGFKLQETFTWVKTQYKPIQGRRRVNNLTEFVFMFSKGKMPLIDRLAVGVPYADKSNIGRYADRDLRCGGNVWTIPYETIQSKEQKLHNDRFPLELPTRCLKLAGVKPGALVCDPFMGSGTTAVACMELGLGYIGWEIDPKHFATAWTRIMGGDPEDDI